MTAIRDIRPIAARIARVALVFMLVFWTSLRIEYFVAFAADAAADSIVADDGAGHEPGQLTDLVVYQWSPADARWKPVPQARATVVPATPEATPTITLTKEAAEQKLVVVPVWNNELPAGYAEGTGLIEVPGAAFVEWTSPLEVTEGEAGCITSEVVGANAKNMLVLTGTANGKAKTTCKVKPSEARTENLSVAVQVVASGFEQAPEEDTKPPVIDSVDLLDSKGEQFVKTPGLTFDKDQLPVKDYQFKASVKISNQEFLEKGVYEAPGEKSLSELSNGLVDDLVWSVSAAEDVAKINQEGVLTITGEGEFTVSCTARVPSTGQSTTSDVVVKAGDPSAPQDDPQGPSHPQETLQIVADLPVQQAPAADEGAGGDEPKPDEVTGQEDDPATPDNPSPENPSSNEPATGPAAGDNPSGDPAPSDQPATSKGINKTYTVEQMEALSTSPARLFHVNAGGSDITVTGKGVSLVDLIRSTFSEAGADLDSLPVKSVTLGTHRLEQTIPWAVLNNSATSPILAVKSYVHTADDPTDKAVADDKLVDNTRYRLLCDSWSSLTGATSTNADDYRWVNKITVNLEKTDSDRLAVGVSYTPVSKGVNAEFVAVPNHNVTGSWNCTWETSADGKSGWTVVGGNSQTLSIPTNDETIGTWYRVTIRNATGLEEGGDPEQLMAVSEPVQLTEGKGLVLSYNPPIAGGLAIFRTHLFGFDSNQVEEYIWQWSENGGETWSEVRNEKSSTLKIPTEPISQSGSSGSGGSGGGGANTPNLIYVRAIAVIKSGDPLISNVQPLTVHTGEDESGSTGDDDGREDGKDGPAGGSTTPTTPGSSSNTPNVPTSRPVTVTEVQSITLETSAPSSSTSTPQAALDPNGTTTTPTTTPTSDPSQLVINDQVSEQITAQQEAADAQAAATTPGARWTKLKTLDPTADDVRTVLAENPFAPFVVPFGLGATAAGGLESFIAFRRQTS